MADSMEDYKEELEASFREIKEGDIISGVVLGVTEEEVTLDLKYYTQGIIKVDDLSNDPNFQIMVEVHPGDVFKGTVVSLDDGQGNIRLSQKEANDVLAWEKLNTYLEEKTELPVKITGIVPSGVVTYVEGIRGFIPASQLDL